MIFVKRLVDENTFDLRSVVDAAFDLFHTQNGSFSVFKFNKNRADFCTQLFLPVSNNFESAHLPDVLHLCLKIIFQLLIHIDCHLHLTVEDV